MDLLQSKSMVHAIAHSFCRSIDVYDQDIHLQTLLILWYPSSLSFMQSLCSGNDSSILAVTDGCQLSIWDLRMEENGGCVHRIYGSVGDIFHAVYSSSTSIAVGGADRTVTIYDPRRWMNSCTKLNCIGQIGTFCIFGRIIYFCIDVYGKY